MKYNFDEIISRENSHSINYEGWRKTAETNIELAPTEEYIRMWVADMDFATPPEILEAMRKRLDKKILGYSAVMDDTYIKVLENWFLKRYTWKINREHLVFSPGVVPALNRLVSLLTTEEEGILINTPSYFPFYSAALINDRKIYFSKLKNHNDHFEISFEDIEKQLKDPKKNIKLFIHCHPHNPTGRVWTRSELERLGKLCLENGVRIISDEIHCDLLREGKTHIPLHSIFPETDKIITCTAPSKTFNTAGNLLSHIFIPETSIRKQWNDRYGGSFSPLAIAGTQAAYEQGEQWLEELKEYLDKNFLFLKKKINTLLPLAKFEIPDSTYLAWIDISAYTKDIPDTLSMRDYFIKKAKVVLEDDTRYVDNSKGFIRLNIAAPQKIIEEGIHRIADVLNKKE